MALLCIVCQFESPKYKCTRCYSSYCSIGCWNIHKTDDSCKKLPQQDSNTNVGSKSQVKSYITKDTISQDKLLSLGSNKELRQLLKNPYLQRILKSVDSSSDPSEAVKNAMVDPDFVQFVDICLGIVEN